MNICILMKFVEIGNYLILMILIEIEWLFSDIFDEILIVFEYDILCDVLFGMRFF